MISRFCHVHVLVEVFDEVLTLKNSEIMITGALGFIGWRMIQGEYNLSVSGKHGMWQS